VEEVEEEGEGATMGTSTVGTRLPRMQPSLPPPLPPSLLPASLRWRERSERRRRRGWWWWRRRRRRLKGWQC